MQEGLLESGGSLLAKRPEAAGELLCKRFASGAGLIELPHETRTTPLPEPTISRTVHVPVYSSIYLGLDVRKQVVDLAVTLSIRNVSSRLQVIVTFVRYYDSARRLVREYVKDQSELAPLASAEFIIPRADTSGGPGANFLVQWVAAESGDEPLIEAVMIGQSGNAGISFTSPGRTVKNEPRQ